MLFFESLQKWSEMNCVHKISNDDKNHLSVLSEKVKKFERKNA